MKCSYTEVFAIASVNKNQVIDTSYAYWKETTRYELDENNSGEGRLIYAPEQQMKQDSNGTTEEHVSMKILTFARNKIIWWRLTKDDIEATIVQEFSKTTFPYGTTVTQNTSKPR